MIVKDNIIVEITEKELWERFMINNYDDFYTFNEYKLLFLKAGTKIIVEDETDERK